MSSLKFFSENNSFHQDKDQLSRQKAACKLNVSLVDSENLCGIINDYNVLLDSCACRDFKMRSLPCKHMYRLAHELGYFSLQTEVINDPNVVNSLTIKNDKELLKQTVSSLSVPAQEILQEIVSLSKKYFPAKHRIFIKELLQVELVITRDLTISDVFSSYTINGMLDFCTNQNPLKATRRASVISFFEKNYPEKSEQLLKDANLSMIFLDLNPALLSHIRLLQRFLAKKLGAIDLEISLK